MGIRHESFLVNGQEISCAVCGNPEPQSMLLLLCGERPDTALLRALRQTFAQTNASFVLAGWEPASWDDGLSPWEALCGDRRFGGDGKTSLDFLTQQLLPALKARYDLSADPAHCGILGYSLAGWFALWAAGETGLFGKAASCSGSLWYPGALEYLQNARFPDGFRCYLSLGKKEPLSKNQWLGQVGHCTEKAAELLAAKPRVAHCRLVWENGTHFTEIPWRIARGVRALVLPGDP